TRSLICAALVTYLPHTKTIVYVRYILHLTYISGYYRVAANRVSLTPFSAPLESSRSSEVNSTTIEEQKMFGRQVTLKIKADSATELTRITENEIIAILRKQKGFRDETTFIAPDRLEAVANSFWDTKADAE